MQQFCTTDKGDSRRYGSRELACIDYRLVLERETGSSDEGRHETEFNSMLLQKCLLMCISHFNNVTASVEQIYYWQWIDYTGTVNLLRDAYPRPTLICTTGFKTVTLTQHWLSLQRGRHDIDVIYIYTTLHAHSTATILHVALRFIRTSCTCIYT